MNGFVVSVDFGNQHWRIPRQIVNRAALDELTFRYKLGEYQRQFAN
jgi:hypothetical protein